MKAKPLLFVFLIVSLLLAFSVPEVKADSTFGKTAKGLTEGTLYSTTQYGCRFQLTEDADITKVTIYIGSGDTGEFVQCGIYDEDGSNLPNDRKSVSDWISIPASDGEVDCPQVVSLSASWYWLAWKIKTTNKDCYYDDGSSDPVDQLQVLGGVASDAGLTDPFGVPTAHAARDCTIYATYTPSAEEEKSFALSETITPSANVYEAKEKQFIETSTFNILSSLAWGKEKLFYATETFVSSTTLILLQEMVFSLDQNVQTVVTMTKQLEKAAVIFAVWETIIIIAQASMIAEIIAAPVEVTTFGTLALVIAIIALAIGVTALKTTKKL